jgi:predicted component of type VI protein secretion system
MLDDELLQWDEGLFVRPQHLQALQRQAVRRHAADRRLLTPFPYGVVAAEPTVIGSQLRFDVLHAVLRDGTVVHHGRNAVVRPLDLPPGHVTVHLAVRSDPAGFRTAAHPHVPDENTGGDPTPVVGRQIDAHLVAGDPPDPGVWESLPVLRISGGRLDEAFAPPCFRLGACRPLCRLVEDVLQRARAARDAAAAALAAGPTEAVTRADVRLMARHRALSHFAAVLSHELRDGSLTPFAAYGTCLRMLAAVRAADLTGGPVDSAYDHDHPWPAFAHLHADLAAATAVPVDPPRQYELRPLDPPLPPDVLGCHPDLDVLLSGRHAAVLAVAADLPEDADAVHQVLSLRNLKVGAPGALVAFQAGLLLPWQLADGEGLPPIHAGPGVTRFIRLVVLPDAPGWQRVRAERTLAVRYPTMTAARRELRLRFRLYVTLSAGGTPP